MANPLNDEFVKVHVNKHLAKRAWDANRVYGKTAQVVLIALKSLMDEHKTHLMPQEYGTMVRYQKEEDGVAAYFRFRIKCTLQFPDHQQQPDMNLEYLINGITQLTDRCLHRLIGEEKFVERKSAHLLRQVAKAESDLLIKHDLPPAEGILAAIEQRQIEKASNKAPSHAPTRKNSL